MWEPIHYQFYGILERQPKTYALEVSAEGSGVMTFPRWWRFVDHVVMEKAKGGNDMSKIVELSEKGRVLRQRIAKLAEDDSDGVWRTVRGRRVFIREGESVGEALKRSLVGGVSGQAISSVAAPPRAVKASMDGHIKQAGLKGQYAREDELYEFYLYPRASVATAVSQLKKSGWQPIKDPEGYTGKGGVLLGHKKFPGQLLTVERGFMDRRTTSVTMVR